MSSRGWFTVPTRDEVAKRKRQDKRAKEAAERGEDFEETLRQQQREVARQRVREEAQKIEAAEHHRQQAAAKERRKAEEEAARRRKQEAVERHQRLKDPAAWPTCVEALAAPSGAALARSLDALLDDEESDALTHGVAGARIEYAMAIVDRATASTRMPDAADDGVASAALEPAATFVAAAAEAEAGSPLRTLQAAVRRQLTADSLAVTDVLHAVAAYFGGKGNKAVSHARGAGLGARLVLQLLLREAAELVAANLDAFTSLFFLGAAGDKSSAAFPNLLFLLEQITATASPVALRNAVVKVANNAAGLDVRASLLGSLGPWFQLVLQRLSSDAKPKASQSEAQPPQLFSASGAVLLVEAAPSVAPALVVECGVRWHPKAGTHLIAPLLKRAQDPSDAFSRTVAAMVAADASLSAQLLTSFASATSQVNAVIGAINATGGSLPKDVDAELRTKIGSALRGDPGSPKGLKASDAAAAAELLKRAKVSAPQRGKQHAADGTVAGGDCSGVRIVVGLGLVVLLGVAFAAPERLRVASPSPVGADDMARV